MPNRQEEKTEGKERENGGKAKQGFPHSPRAPVLGPSPPGISGRGALLQNCRPRRPVSDVPHPPHLGLRVSTRVRFFGEFALSPQSTRWHDFLSSNAENRLRGYTVNAGRLVVLTGKKNPTLQYNSIVAKNKVGKSVLITTKNTYYQKYIWYWSFFLFFLFLLFRATPKAYEVSQPRGQIGAMAASLHHSHSNKGSKLHLWPTPQLTATPDPQPTERGQGLNPHPHGA